MQTRKFIVGLSLNSLLAAALSCGSDPESTGVDCVALGNHLTKICAQPLGEGARSDCQVFGLDKAIADCVMQLTECHAAEVNWQCGLVDIIQPCKVDEDCPAPLLCSSRYAGCAECDTDADCTAPQECGGGACFVRQR